LVFKNLVLETPLHLTWNRAYKSGMSNLILGLSFTQTAREAVHAMNQGAIAFESYYNNDSHMEGSTLIQARYNHSKDHHLPLNDIARSEFAHGIALLSNTVPNTFWMLYHIYSDPRLLAECRKELAHVIVAINDKQGKPTKTIDISKVKTSCPLFLSIYKEVLRFYSTSISARLVMEDFLLDNQYLLKKGSTVMMPNPVQHRNPALWGAQNDVFDPRRFTDAEKRHHPAGFRAFGGGTTLCPGRHFATTEILAFTAVMIMQFDIIPMSGEWPKELKTAVEFWEATPSPNQDFDVEIRPKDGEMGTGKWAFILSDLDRPIALSLEDETL
jgi:cytochrome P450